MDLWVGAFERTSPLTGQVLEDQQAICWYGIVGYLGFSRTSCILFSRRVATEQGLYPPVPTPIGAVDSGADEDMFVGLRTFALPDHAALGYWGESTLQNISMLSDRETTNEWRFIGRLAATNQEWMFRGTRARDTTSTVYGSYREGVFAGAATAFTLAMAEDPTIAGSPLFVQGGGCSATLLHESHFSNRGWRTALQDGNAKMTGGVQCGTTPEVQQGGFAFFAPPSFVPNAAGYTGALYFALTSGGPLRLGYGLKYDDGPRDPFPYGTPTAMYPVRAQSAVAGSPFILRDFQGAPCGSLSCYFNAGLTPLRYEIIGTLPGWLSVDVQTGNLTGTPTSSDVRSAPYVFQARAATPTGQYSPTRQFEITVRNP